MNKIASKLFPVFALVATAATLHAQHGCGDSPEAPTDVLMLVGSAGMFYGSSVIMKFVRGRRK